MPPGRTSAASPGRSHLRNAYIREDQITPHLAALAILLVAPEQTRSPQADQGFAVTSPVQAAQLISDLRATGRTLTYDPLQHSLRASADYGTVVIIGRSH